MSSVWESLPPLVESGGPAAVVRLIERAELLAFDSFGDGPEGLLVVEGLDLLKDAAPDLSGLAAQGLASLLSQFVSGHPDVKARFVVASMTFDERRAASHAATAATVQARVDLEASWDRVAEVLQAVGEVALKVIPLLLAAA